ncbi:MAG: zinc ribbon domain-containing protein [Candidatus Freyarchaeota archaeon]|nr:zinc ribbon domain-containing protein [Candidatus Freyrarchaeum guaymaensis]
MKSEEDGVEAIYVNPCKTSILCPICGRKLSPNGHRLLKCECGLIADGDVIGSWNIMLRGLKMDVGSPVPPESPPMKMGGGKAPRYTHIKSYEKIAESQNG